MGLYWQEARIPYNGSGVWTRLQNWTNNANAGIKIRADLMDQDTNDICSNGLGLALTRDGQGVATAKIPFPFGIKSDTIDPNTASGPITISTPTIQSGSSTVLATVPSDAAIAYSRVQITSGIAASSTADIFRFLNPAGTLIGTNFISGTFYINIVDAANAANSTTTIEAVVTTGNGAANTQRQELTGSIRGTSLLSSYQIAADGGGGSSKLQIVTAANGTTVNVRVYFVGLVL